MVIGEIFITFAFLALAIVFSAIWFVGWVAFTVVRGIVNGVSKIALPRAMGTASVGGARCLSSGCGAMNPTGARFCRRCGRAMIGQQRVQVRRAAVW